MSVDFRYNAVLIKLGDCKRSRILLQLNAEILAFFKAMGPTYQTRMNEVLRAHMEANRK
jgi:uncharacterized protein (DUF4415 family)